MPTPYLRTIRLADTDAAGVVYFASALSICHEAYEDALSQQGLVLAHWVRERAIALPIVRAEIEFGHPLFWGDELQVELEQQPLSESDFQVRYRIAIAGVPEPILVRAVTRHACISLSPRRRIPLPDEVLAWLHSSRRSPDANLE